MPQPSHCSPKVDVDNRSPVKSCFTYPMLLLIARMYNQTHSNKIEITKSRSKLWKDLQKRLDNACGNNEACWIEQPFVSDKKQEVLEAQFRPEKPSTWKNNPREWLNTYDILDVMKQYEDSDKTYKFLGVFPVDFAHRNSATGICVVQDMCDLNVAESWAAGVRQIGVIFNLDKSTESGSHWVSLFIGLDPRRKTFGVYYYDSVASKPPKEIAAFMRLIRSDLRKLHGDKKTKTMPFAVNKVRRQYKGTECGLFSMLFQIMMLSNRHFDVVCEKMGYDDDVHKFRDLLYRPSQVTTNSSR